MKLLVPDIKIYSEDIPSVAEKIRLLEPQLVRKYVEGDKQIGVHAQRVGLILNANEEDRKNSDENWSKSDPDIKRVGCIPRTIAILWQQNGIMDDPDELMKALERNPEYKTTEKRLI